MVLLGHNELNHALFIFSMQVNFAALADQPDSAQYFERNAATHHEDKSPQLRLKTGAYQVLDDGSTEAWVA